MVKSLSIAEFMAGIPEGKLIDVRTPAEFEKGHIPGAENLPLFSNEERVIIGTIYKQQGRQPAILKGLEITGPKMSEFIKQALDMAGESKKLYLYCWRGGMRSGSMAWLLDLYGFEVYTLKRGYKAFRNFVLDSFKIKKNILILGGKTGSGKTIILKEFKKMGEQVVDLEGLAHHKGSAFGTIGETESCTQEHFENKLAMALIAANPELNVWMEDESRCIGKKILPEGLWIQMRSARVIYLDMPVETRLKYITETYGLYPKDELLASVEKIKKRLGGLAYKQTITYINEGQLDKAAEILLAYYDKGYGFGLEKREPDSISVFETTETDFEKIAVEILNFRNHFKVQNQNNFPG